MSARALAGWAALLPLSALPAQAQGETASAAARAFAEVQTPRASAWLGETVRVRLRFGFEREFLEREMIQLFQRPLDVPAQVNASWLAGTSCAQLVVAVAEQDDASTAVFALGDGIERARRAPEELRGGVPFAVFELERDFVVLCPGELALEPPALRIAYATRFRTDAFGDRVPEDRRDESLVGTGLTLPVLALPEEGRPPDFSGAVGSFTVEAQARPLTLAAGQSVKLELAIRGDGDVTRCAVPRLDRVVGMRAQGWVDEVRDGARVVTYDVFPLVSGRAAMIPAIEFSYFDPAPPGSYRTATTELIPLTLTTEAGDPAVVPPPDTPAGAQGRTWKAILGFLFFVVMGVGARVAFLLRRRARAADPGGVDEKIARAIAREVSGRPVEDLGQAFAAYLASRLECPVPAVIGPGLAERMTAAGISVEGARAVAALLDELVAARYGGSAASDAAERTRAAVEALELEFRRASRRP